MASVLKYGMIRLDMRDYSIRNKGFVTISCLAARSLRPLTTNATVGSQGVRNTTRKCVSSSIASSTLLPQYVPELQSVLICALSRIPSSRPTSFNIVKRHRRVNHRLWNRNTTQGTDCHSSRVAGRGKYVSKTEESARADGVAQLPRSPSSNAFSPLIAWHSLQPRDAWTIAGTGSPWSCFRCETERLDKIPRGIAETTRHLDYSTLDQWVGLSPR